MKRKLLSYSNSLIAAKDGSNRGGSPGRMRLRTKKAKRKPRFTEAEIPFTTEKRFAAMKISFIMEKKGRNRSQLSDLPRRRMKSWISKQRFSSPSLAHFPNAKNICSLHLSRVRIWNENNLLRVSPLFFLNHLRVCDFVYFTLDLV